MCGACIADPPLPPLPLLPPVLVPVPLHRWRLWSRGFNQSAEVARHLGRLTGIAIVVDALVRHRQTPVLRGMGRAARARAVRGVFAVPGNRRAAIAGRTIFLVDDVFTTGSTTAACARTLLRAGAARVEVVAFARVVVDTPDDIDTPHDTPGGGDH